ncbi:MAG TPA: DNA polymerase III subunit delta [Gemmatimonadaceae bacterium]|nr:DNA polymerase III subunit delta [Gemmatimonadaceae bacterium]
MPAAPLKTLRKALESGDLARVYYFHGDEEFLKDETVRRLIERAVEPATRDFNLEQHRGAEIDGETLFNLVNTLPMIAERRVVVIRDVGSLRKEARAVLDTYLRAPSPDTVLVLVAAAGAKGDRALIGHTVAVEFKLLTEKQLPIWIDRHVGEMLGLEITPEAVGLLQSAVGPDLPQLASELEKLASFVRGSNRASTIDADAVAEVVGVRQGESLGDLLDSVAERDARGALAILPHVLMQPKTSAVPIVMMLGTQTLAMAWARAALDEGLPRRQLFGELMELLKLGGSPFWGRPWGEAIGVWTRAVDRWDAASLDQALQLLLDADSALKESRVSSDEQMLTTLVLALCGIAPRAAAAA